MKVLLVRFSSIGDIVLTSPVVRCLKEQLPDVEIHYLSKRRFEGILAFNPHIDKLLLIDKKVSEVRSELKTAAYDFVVDLHHNLRSAQVKQLCGCRSTSLKKHNIEKWLMVRFKWNLLPKQHIVDRYMDCVKSLGVTNDGKGLEYYVPEADRVVFSDEFGIPEPFIAFAIGGQHKGKILPEKKIISICSKLHRPVVLLGGKEDAVRGSRIAKMSEGQVVNLCGMFNLNQSASILTQAETVISHDTGLMHIAAAFKKRVISVWGCTIPAFGMYPYMAGEGSKIIEVNGLPSRPCSKLGKGMCKDFACMNLIDEWAIAEACHHNAR